FGFPDQEARETHYAIHIPWAMGLIGTRSLTTEIPGIDKLEEQAKDHIREGIKAYDALMKIRAAKPATPGEVSQDVATARTSFEDIGHELGYALLLKRYVDDPRQATEEQIAQAARDTIPNVPTLFWSFRIMVGL
ncbi:cytochrome ubiquinol oxidase subunit I, partial [Rhizobium dioscoreae]